MILANDFSSALIRFQKLLAQMANRVLLDLARAAYVTIFLIQPLRLSHSLHGWCMLAVFFASIRLSRTRTSGSFESVRWNVCVHRLDLGFYSHLKKFFGERSQNTC